MSVDVTARVDGAPSLRRLRRRDARLVPVAGAAWIAAAVATLNPGGAGAAALVLWAAALLAVLVAVRARQPMRTWWALGAVSAAIAAAVCVHVAVALPAREALATLEIDGGRSLTLDLHIVGKVEPSPAGVRFDALVTRVARGDDTVGAVDFPGGVPVVVRSAHTSAGLDLGARIRVTGTAWRADAGDRAVLVVDAAAAPEMVEPPAGVLAVASALRQGLLDATSGLPQPGAGLVSGLAVGDTTGVDASLDAAMKASSLSHLTAVSGANCALVVAGAFGLAALCRARRGIRVAAGVAALAGFVVLVSPEPSVVRAAAMALIAMLGLLLGRPGAGLSLLAAAATVLLVLDPWLALSLGFALSAVATGALLIGAGPLADGLASWMPRPLALAIAVPLAAQLACGPIIVLIAPQLSMYGVVANMLAAPAAPLGTILGLAACFGAAVPLLGSGLAALAWLPAAWIAATATTLAALPGAVTPWPEGWGGFAALAVVGAAVAALIIPVRRRLRLLAMATVSVTVAVALAFGPVGSIVERTATPSSWAIAACDIGQGDAVLIRSAGATALIDTGPDPGLLRSCLDRLGVGRIDLLVLTHFDLDHSGGVDALRGIVGSVLHGPVDTPDDQRLLDGLSAAGARVTEATVGMGGALGAARWRVLWPRGGAPPGNDASVVVDIQGAGVPSALFLGDLSAEGQRAMRSRALMPLSYAVVKVSHHGSRDQDPELYRRIRAALALISVGENTYGHPRAETLDMLTALGTRIARTDLEGLLLVGEDDGALRLWHEHAAT